MSKYLPEGWTQDKIDDALESQRKYPNPTNPKQEGMNMNNQAKDNLENATARPWNYTVKRIRGGGKVIASTAFIDTGASSSMNLEEKIIQDRENRANAALIVRAVNSYDALVEACYLAVESLENEDCRTAIQNEALKSALNALKLAKGE